MISSVFLPIAIFCLLTNTGSSFLTTSSCSYGPRGSLTAICVNATPYYFKLTNYRFDYLDETLLCKNCTLKNLEQGTFDIPGNEIKTLDISNSSVVKIWPKAFIGMIYMNKLILAHNPIEVIYPEAFLGVRKVKYLDMDDTVSQLQPKVFQELHLLEVLLLTRNRLEEIVPGTFDGLDNLRILDLTNNKLKHVNESFNALINLRILKLKNNLIRELYGNEFLNLRSLYSLNLEDNNLVNFTINLAPDNRLRALNLARNFLSAKSFKPGTFDHLNYLEEFDLSNNNFRNVSTKMLQGLYRLRVLNLNDNEITNINTGSFSGLPHLRVLNISRNNIHTLAVTGRFTLPSLVSLDVSNNDIVDLDYLSLVIRTPRLKFIDFKYNRLSCKTFGQLESLFDNDGISYLVTDTPDLVACPKVDQSVAAQLVKSYAQNLENQYVNSTLLIWMFILITIVIMFIGILFYVQFYIVLKMGNPPHKRIRILNNLSLRRNENNSVNSV